MKGFCFDENLPARLTFRVCERWYTPGVKNRFSPCASAAFRVAALSAGRAT